MVRRHNNDLWHLHSPKKEPYQPHVEGGTLLIDARVFVAVAQRWIVNLLVVGYVLRCSRYSAVATQ